MAGDALPGAAPDDASKAALLAAADAITRAHWAQLAARATRPLRRQGQRCLCALGGACARCGRCVEMHCACGARARRRALCLESRPCDCALADASARCPLCRGCRRAAGGGHCRCEQHARQRSGDAPADSAEASCACFRVAASAMPRKVTVSDERTQRIRRLQRATGVPSVESLFQRTIVPAFGSADSGEEEQEDGDNGTETGDLSSVLHRPLVRRLFPLSTYTPPYQQLHLRAGSSFLESIEPREHNERASARIGSWAGPRANADQEAVDEVTTEQIERGLSNVLYTKERESAMPSDGLVDYLIHAASIKVGRASEMVGTFDDSAAVAAAIVVEEYMQQVARELLMGEASQARALTKPDVQASALHLLMGLNWTLFREQHDCAHDPSKQDDELVRAIGKEIALLGSPSAGGHDEMAAWIRETVSEFHGRWQTESERVRAVGTKTPRQEHSDIEARNVRSARQKQQKVSEAQEPHVRLGVRQHEVSGRPSYFFTMETKLPGDQLVRVRVSDIDTREQAMSRVDAVKETLRSQHERLWSAMHNRLPSLKQHLVSAEHERPTGRVFAKATIAEKRLLAAHDPVLLAKLEHRRQQQNQWRKIDRRKKKAERVRQKAERAALALSAAGAGGGGNGATDGGESQTTEAELENPNSREPKEQVAQSTNDPSVATTAALLEQQVCSSVQSTTHIDPPVSMEPPRRKRGRPRKSRM